MRKLEGFKRGEFAGANQQQARGGVTVQQSGQTPAGAYVKKYLHSLKILNQSCQD